MIRGKPAVANPVRRARGAVLAALLAVWAAPAAASSGVSMECDQDAATPVPADISPVPTLAAHTDSALKDILEDDALKVPALAEAAAESAVDDAEANDAADDATARATSDAPVINTRLPGVSESSLPSFRRQMYRTDI